MTWEKWLSAMVKYLVDGWGLDKNFAEKISVLYYWFEEYGLNPQITSGYRSKQYQQELINRYNRGDPSIIVRPSDPANTSHSKTGGLFGNKPAALAVDISTNNRKLAADIAVALNVGAGYYYRISDGVHFYQVSI